MSNRQQETDREPTVRESIATVIVRMDVPLGFTLTIWSAGDLAERFFGKPDLPIIFAFVAGAGLAYLLVGYALARSAPRAIGATQKTPRFALLNVLAALLAVSSLSVGYLPMPPALGYFVLSFTGTFVFLVALGLLDHLGLCFGLGRRREG